MTSVTDKWLRRISFLGICACTAAMVVYSPAVMSIGMGVAVAPAFCVMPVREQLRRFVHHTPAVLFSLLLLLQIVSGLWTREAAQQSWLSEVTLKLPLFLGMYGLAVLGPFSVKSVRILLMVLLFAACFVGTGTLVDYLIHKQEIDHRVEISKEVEIWLGCNHIYFSVIMAFAILGGIWSLLQPDRLLFKGEKWLVLVVLGVCVVEMHVLTTRTGLVGLYLTLLILGWIELVRRRKFVFAFLLPILLALMPVVGYYGLSSFRNRIDNSVMDVTEYFKGNDPNYLSIGTRIESWKTGYRLWQKNPILGVGMADLKADMTDQYVEDQTKLCPENFQLPHNQFLQNLAGLGMVGLVLLLVAWFFPILSKRWPKDLLFWAFWVNFTLAMLGESMMERQLGVSFLVPMYMYTLGVGRIKT